MAGLRVSPKATRTTAALIGLTALALAIVLVLRLGSYYLYLVNLTLVNAIGAIGLVVVSGVAGQMSLATAGLLAIGSYTTGILTTTYGVDFGAAAVIGAILTTIIGTMLAGPALRLTGLHLAIVTLAFSEIVLQLIGAGGAFTGGQSGMAVASASLLGWSLDTEKSRFILVGVTFVLVVLATRNFLRFKAGRALFAMREREPVARALGVDVSAYKTLAFAYGSFLAGLAGALFVTLKGFISVDDFTIQVSLYFFVMIAVGGMTSIWGGVVGAAFVTLLPEALRDFRESSDAVFGILLTLVVAFLPGGLVAFGRALWQRLLASRRPVALDIPGASERDA